MCRKIPATLFQIATVLSGIIIYAAYNIGVMLTTLIIAMLALISHIILKQAENPAQVT